ncbi:MAG: very short patch repair endonuclease [Candidatus Aenigmarchaeota archaeon]|nr:very short patch repair endonuclease [Candidatus Aenigmarchaeota archaeon]
MSKIKSKDTKLEMAFRKRLWKNGLRYKVYPNILGRPDLVFSTQKLAIFIDSCFWHNCPKHARKPNSNKEYWNAKLKRNYERDKRVTRELKNNSWKVMRFWEHDLKDLDKCVERVAKEI